ncbi:hypothetical protein I553_0117 [Mycobacterium xenopi 4042]|uniref:Uncharacterized protein n=1 Tax=Mycobacterium xenopi 4042 TaxID=1299334 RepID=X7YLD6_MYCXE|nr:hypothetical protein I553_0117 [Mycobacterium xenopi 4042]
MSGMQGAGHGYEHTGVDHRGHPPSGMLDPHGVTDTRLRG